MAVITIIEGMMAINGNGGGGHCDGGDGSVRNDAICDGNEDSSEWVVLMVLATEMVMMGVVLMVITLVVLVPVVMMMGAMVTGTLELCFSLQVSSESRRLGCCSSSAWMDSQC